MILDTLAAAARERVQSAKERLPLALLEKQAAALPITENFPFEAAVGKEGLSFICEVKRASPSKGLIAPDFPYMSIAREYEEAGADAVSVLTEPRYFLGSDEYLREIAKSVSLPCLRKDFTVDIYQIFEAKLLGAAAVLLICSISAKEELAEYVRTAHALGLSALTEAHDEREIDIALGAGARIIGVNNRDLKTFSVDTGNAARLRERVPSGVLFVSESGVQSAADIRAARAIRADAVLVGESMMKASDKRAFLKELKDGEN
ncbi:MAG: indole-3-glycerol phosphate synthase TrpC [Oscillospiraceae bacterium]|jgi:indole-3-glycerol phosphate synthase|nr:indole-3-glycerol phosphate synthase TrpC [Oscillospiraceae bacterium]